MSVGRDVQDFAIKLMNIARTEELYAAITEYKEQVLREWCSWRWDETKAAELAAKGEA